MKYEMPKHIKEAFQKMDFTVQPLAESVQEPEQDPNELVNFKLTNGKIRIIKLSTAQLWEFRGLGKIQ